ncbi:MAG TPA: ABC transporter ATP-binding protein [bacterium]|nr:ABC transporter ATP-binding protein [bacterium]
MIQFSGVYKSFGDNEVLKGIDLDLPASKISVILGPSGEGKSVLLKHMIGLIRPDKGRVIVDGTDLSKLDDKALTAFRKNFGMLFQNAALFDSFNVEDNIAFPLREHTDLSEKEIAERVRQKLDLVGLKGAVSKMPSELSGGMRKRVGLARAIALEPRIILYDEPTTGLDPLMTDTINRLIVDTHHALAGTAGDTQKKSLSVTTVVISHDIEATFQVADFVAMIHDGVIIESGAPSVFEKSRHPFVRKFLDRHGDDA